MMIYRIKSNKQLRPHTRAHTCSIMKVTESMLTDYREYCFSVVKVLARIRDAQNFSAKNIFLSANVVLSKLKFSVGKILILTKNHLPNGKFYNIYYIVSNWHYGIK